MIKMIITIFGLILLFIPIVNAQSGGGGGGSNVLLTVTLQECNELLNNKITIYENAAKKADTAFKLLMSMFVAFFVVLIVSLLIRLGMVIQQIKNKGFKQWWEEKLKSKK